MPQHYPLRKQRILSIAFPHLATDQIARQKWGKSWTLNERPKAPPIVVTDTIKNAIRIIAYEAHARQFGLFVEQSLSDARALVPDLENHMVDFDALSQLLLSIAAWCERYTPLVALSHNPNRPMNDGLFLDITGCAHLFDGEEKLLEDVEKKLNIQGFSIRASISDTPGAAWAMAHFGTERIIQPQKHVEAIDGLPLYALRLSKKLVENLNRVGLKTIGCIADLPRAPLAARFGKELLQKLDYALGRQEESISPIRPVHELVCERRFNDPIVYEDDIKKIIEALAGNLIPTLERRGVGVRECGLRLFRVDGKVSFLNVHSAKPLRHANQIARLFFERLTKLHDDLDLGFGFDLIRLEVLRSDTFDNQQTDLVDGKQHQGQYDDLVNRLSARLGSNRVQHFSYTKTHIPEREFAYANNVHSTSAANYDLEFKPVHQLITRPAILFDRPEPIETIAQIPDGPPMLFRWRKVFYDVAKSEGPERIACEWWRDGRGAKTRDYFRVEDRQGYRFWLFRHGLYERETNHPDWYMHGLFA